MPSHFTHIYAARRVADFLERGSFLDNVELGTDRRILMTQLHGPLDPVYLAGVMRKWERFTALGAIGPDIFFFSQDYSKPFIPSDEIMLALSIYYMQDAEKKEDYEALLIILDQVDHTFAKVLRLIIKINKVFKELVKAWDDTIGKVFGVVETAIDDLTGGSLEALQVAISNAAKALIAIAAEEVLTFKDVFSWFSLNMRKGWDEQDFLWSDMTHYRRTSEVPRRLIDQAIALRDSGKPGAKDMGEQLLAFAMGWICHVGVDTICHSFVNEQCGGPFRTHWQRHHLVEAHVDEVVYRGTAAGGNLPFDPWGSNDTYPDVGSCALVYAVALSPAAPQGQDRPPTLPEDRTARTAAVNIDGEMPDFLANAISQALIDTYQFDKHPSIYGGSDFQTVLQASDTILARVFGMVMDKPLDRPFQELLDLVAPTPPMHVPHGFILPWQVKTTYRFMLSFYKMAFFDKWDLRKPKKPDFIITPPASDFTDLFSAPDFSGASSGDPVQDACDAIRSFFDWLGKELEAAAKLLGDIIKMIASPGSYPIRLALYQVAMWCWDAVQNTHALLAHTGFLMPHAEQHYPDGELALMNEIDVALVTLGHTVDGDFQHVLKENLDIFGNLDHALDGLSDVRNPHDRQYPWYPQRQRSPAVWDATTGPGPGDLDVIEFRRPWTFPNMTRAADGSLQPNQLELPLSFAGPYPQGATPDGVFFRLGRPVRQHERIGYEVATTPDATDRLSVEVIGNDPRADHSPLGDPVPFSAYLIGQICNNPEYTADFNLDADRGYGYRCWDWDRGDGTGHSDRGSAFGAPVAYPEGADAANQHWRGTSVPMRLHYLERAAPNANPLIAEPARAPQ
jgi:hypothetical protein